MNANSKAEAEQGGGAAFEATVHLSEDRRPARDATHGTADPMVWRRIRFLLPRGSAEFEQTDYGHPGRFNPWEPRQIAPALQPRTEGLRAAAERLFSLLR